MKWYEEVFAELLWLLSIILNPIIYAQEGYIFEEHETKLDKILFFVIVPLMVLRLVVQFLLSDSMDASIFMVSLVTVPIIYIFGIKFVYPRAFAYLLKLARVDGLDFKSASIIVYPPIIVVNIFRVLITTVFAQVQIVLSIAMLVRCCWNGCTN